MWKTIRRICQKFSGASQQQHYASAFFSRYTDRTLIVHAGLSIAWLEELLKVGGGGGHFRIDIRQMDARRGIRQTNPIEWLIQTQILPLNLPLPLLIQVQARTLRLRHLTRKGVICYPGDVPWLLEDMATRVHVSLHWEGTEFRLEHGIPLEDNSVTLDDGITI